MKNQHHILSAIATIVATAALATISLAGCSPDDPRAPTFSCATKGPCESDPIPSASEAAACEALAKDPTCGAAFTAYSECAFSAAICMDGGISDPSADATSAACASDYAAYTMCLENKINTP
jgi:hypothetical protein